MSIAVKGSRCETVDALKNGNIFVVGAANFVGSHLVMGLLWAASASSIIGIDNMND